MSKLIFGFCLLFAVAARAQERLTPAQYVEQYKALAIHEMKRSGVPAAITLAQGILESESGNSDLVRRSNNHFGIKCKSSWTGPSVAHDDDAPRECFRAYDDAEGSFRDHSDFLRNSPRYSFLFDLEPDDYAGWSHGLKKAGYATNPRYGNILIENIERYNLNQYTIEGLLKGVEYSEYQAASSLSMHPGNLLSHVTESDPFVIRRIGNLKAVNVPAGTSLLAVATKMNVRLARLMEWNELEKDGILTESTILFLEKKHPQGDVGSLVIKQDQTLYDIAQNLGITASSLALFNRLSPRQLIKAGTVVYLQPRTETSAMPASEPVNIKTFHVVEPREGLYAISKKYGVTVDELKEWNYLDSDHLQVGQKLAIYQ